jgi:hypothetical protein
MYSYLKIFIFISIIIVISSEFVCENNKDGIYQCYENIVNTKTTEYNCMKLTDQKIICNSKYSSYVCSINNNLNQQICIKHYTFDYFLNCFILGFTIYYIVKLLPVWLSNIILQGLIAHLIILN